MLFLKRFKISLTVLLFLLMVADWQAKSFGASVSIDDDNLTLPTKELTLLYNFDYDVPSPEAIVDVVNGVTQGPPFLNLLGNPDRARFLIRDRLPLSEKATLSPDDPRLQLQHYVVLKYPSNMQTVAFENILERLQRDSKIRWIGKNGQVVFSGVPNDPSFSTSAIPNPIPPPSTSAEQWYQWGMTSLNLPSAWDHVTGHAYVAALDRGIEFNVATQQAHPDLAPNFRLHFSRDFTPTNIPGMNVDETDYYVSGIGNLRGHGTHVAGIIAASTNTLPTSRGVAGTCWNCSLMIGKISTGGIFTDTDVKEGIEWMVKSGAQVINMSFQYILYDRLGNILPPVECNNDQQNPWCQAIKAADKKDVVLINSSGNFGSQFDYVMAPGNDIRVLSIGAVGSDNNRPAFSNYGQRLDLVAPGVNILSTFYTDFTWYPAEPEVYPWGCGDSYGGPSGYGPCTGTSMSAPYVTGLVGLLRSVNPLLYKADIKDILTSSADLFDPQNPDTKNLYKGFGMPDASKAVRTALGKVQGRTPDTLQNRLTPLFSMYSSAAEDHFYTTVPQMALAAFYGTLQPQPPSPDGPVYYAYTSTGAVTPGYSGIPCSSFDWCPPPPKASAYIFTTENSPIAGTPPLVPLYRMSYQGNFTGNNPSHVDHAYTTEQDGINYLKNRGYKLDGIEGYIYNRDTTPQPPGTVRLFRKESLLTGDHAIFPETEIGQYDPLEWVDDGYEWIGYVYPNIDTDGDHLIDGFERLIGTCVGNPHTNGSQILDGDAVMTYSGGPTGTHSYGDPGLCGILAISKTGTGSGTITSNLGGINCGTECTEEFAMNTNVTLYATPSGNSVFTGWSGGGCSGSGNCQVTPSGVTNVTAAFALVYTVTGNADGNGTGTVTSNFGGINYSYPIASSMMSLISGGTAVTLTATGTNGSSGSWAGCDSTAGNGTGTALCNISSLNANRTVSVTFTPQACANLPVRIARTTPVYYSSTQDAYNAAAPGEKIQTRALTLIENLSVNRNIAVTLEGGYDCGFSANSGNVSYFKGALQTFSGGGTITTGNIILVK